MLKDNKKNKDKKRPFKWLDIIIFLIYLAIAIPLHFLWDAFTMHWFWFGFFIVFIPVSFINFFTFFVIRKKPNEKQKKNLGINIVKYVFLCWLYDLLYMSIFNNWLILEYVFGVLAISIIFYNLTKAFLSEYNSLKWMLLFDLIFGVGLSIYLIYILPDVNLQTIMTSIISALYGGFLTLIGVAWTIRHTNAEKKKDELKAIHPFIYPFNSFNDFDSKQLVTLEFFEENMQISKSKYVGMIKNTDNGILILKELIVDDERFYIRHGDILDKNSFAQILLYSEKDLQFKKVTIVGTDVRGYVVAFNVELDEDKKEIVRIIEEDING